MSEQVRSVTRKKSSDFHGGIQFQSSFTSIWELEDKNFLKIDIICLGIDTRLLSVKVKCPDPAVALHNQKPDRGDSLRHQIPAPCPHIPPSPSRIYIDRYIRLTSQHGTINPFTPELPITACVDPRPLYHL